MKVAMFIAINRSGKLMLVNLDRIRAVEDGSRGSRIIDASGDTLDIDNSLHDICQSLHEKGLLVKCIKGGRSMEWN